MRASVVVVLIALFIAGLIYVGIFAVNPLILGPVEIEDVEVPTYKLKCRLVINSTHIAKECQAYERPWKIVLSGDVAVDYSQFRERFGIEKVNYTLIHAVNLRDRYAYAYKIVDFGNPELGVFKKLLYREPIRYEWVDLGRYYPAEPVSLYLYDKDSNEFVFRVAVLTYEVVNCEFDECILKYHLVTDDEALKKYELGVKPWCYVIEGLTGIKCRVEFIKDNTTIKWKQYIKAEREGSRIMVHTKEFEGFSRVLKGSDLNTIFIVETPGSIFDDERGRPFFGLWINKLHIALISYSSPENPSIDTIFHELGHALGLGHFNEAKVINKFKWYKQLFMGMTPYIMWVSVMNGAFSCSPSMICTISGGDVYILASAVRLPRPDIISRFKSLGIDPIYGRALIPLTSNNTIPEPIATILSQGPIGIKFDMKGNIASILTHPEFWEALKTIAKNAETT